MMQLFPDKVASARALTFERRRLQYALPDRLQAGPLSEAAAAFKHTSQSYPIDLELSGVA
jgi:hypothetical protein